MDKIQEIREALAEATPGPWTNLTNQFGSQVGDSDQNEWICQLWDYQECDMENHIANAHLIANAPSYISYLLETVEQLQQENNRLVSAGKRIAEQKDRVIKSLTNQLAAKAADSVLNKDKYEQAEKIVGGLNTWAEHKRFLSSVISRAVKLEAETEQLTDQNTTMKEALEGAKTMIISMSQTYPGEGWNHPETDTWVQAAEYAADDITALLSTIEGGKDHPRGLGGGDTDG